MKSQPLVIASCISVCSLLFSLGSCSEKQLRRPQLQEVEIAQMQFRPAVLTALPGDTIRFVNHDMVPHDVTEQSAKAWHSSPLQPGESWLHVADRSADYYCSLHQVMKGKIIVNVK
jgi:plastocyanin